MNIQLICKAITLLSLRLPKARSAQLKAVVISERMLGFDHPNTIQQYVSTLLHCETTSQKRHIIVLCLLSHDVGWFSFGQCVQAFLGVYMFAGGETSLAQKCFLRARLLTLTIHGEDHPYVATIDVGAPEFPTTKIKVFFALQ